MAEPAPFPRGYTYYIHRVPIAADPLRFDDESTGYQLTSLNAPVDVFNPAVGLDGSRIQSGSGGQKIWTWTTDSVSYWVLAVWSDVDFFIASDDGLPPFMRPAGRYQIEVSSSFVTLLHTAVKSDSLFLYRFTSSAQQPGLKFSYLDNFPNGGSVDFEYLDCKPECPGGGGAGGGGAAAKFSDGRMEFSWYDKE